MFWSKEISKNKYKPYGFTKLHFSWPCFLYLSVNAGDLAEGQGDVGRRAGARDSPDKRSLGPV